MTILALSEDRRKKIIDDSSFKFRGDETLDKLNLYRTQALSHLVSTTTKELEDLNKHLEERVEQEVNASLEKDAIVQANSRHAQMGEMLGMILHQWRQPLSALTSGISSLQVYKELGMLDDDKLDESLAIFLKYLEHLNQTVEDFRDFFKTSVKKELIKPSAILKKLSVLLSSILTKYSIEFKTNIEFDEDIYIHIGEMLQVYLNIIKNAVDAIVEANKNNGKIVLNIYKDDKYCIFDVMDNGGGIPEDILPKIFDKRFTTKGETHGTGIGLDMSKTMIEGHLKGKLEAINIENGAKFSIKIPLNK
jgi:signal transduction histidine kinase